MNRRLDLSALMRLQKQHRRAAQSASGGPRTSTRLEEVIGFGSNPGNLRMLTHVPKDLPVGAPLIVALHGCTQSAAAYDEGTGLSRMADALGFALLLPEQQRANNANLCFNWFEPGDTAREAGEPHSIRQVIAHLVREHRLDPARIFVTGLSAGGAMTSVMLATYPEVFAAGAVIAGLPYAGGIGVAEALRTMACPSDLLPAARGAAVRGASAYTGPWPRVAIWQGQADTTVSPDNADEIAKQWLDLHGLSGRSPDFQQRSATHAERRWIGVDGTPLVELHRIAGMAHGVPLHPGEGEGMAGIAGAYMLDVGVSSTHEILRFFGLSVPQAARKAPLRPRGIVTVDSVAETLDRVEPVATARPVEPKPEAAPQPRPAFAFTDPGAVITEALRAAGLMGTDRR
ncbi:alpha/beta hydrolase family esterase [Roseomonas sp. GCM10028921]